jgi:ketosteroid isomerase-like protein
MRSFIALLVLLVVGPITAADERALAVEYIKARCSTLSKGADEADVDRVLALLTDDAVIEHPRFGQTVRGKDEIRRGMMSHLADYTGDEHDSGIVVLSSVEAPGVIAFRTNTAFVVGEGAGRKVISRDGLMIVQVSGSQISRLIEY